MADPVLFRTRLTDWTPEQAAAVLAYAPDRLSKLTASLGHAVIRAWLIARGYVPDRWGNLARSTETRWHFQATVVRQQRHYADGWRNSSAGVSLIDGAADLIRQAATVAGRADLVAAYSGAREARAKVVEKRRARATSKAETQAAERAAWKLLAVDRPEATIRYWSSKEPDPALTSRHARYVTEILAGTPVPPDGDLVSLEHPPLLPLYADGVDYRWDVQVDGVPYTVRIGRGQQTLGWLHGGRGGDRAMRIHIGTGGGMLAIDPLGLRVHEERATDLAGDGVIAGVIEVEGDVVAARLTYIAAQKPRHGAGRRLLAVWCQLMRGYGLSNWWAEAPNNEAAAALVALHKGGDVHLASRRGSAVRLICTMPGDQLVLPSPPTMARLLARQAGG